MAISKVNNIAYASLGKFKGVTKANLGKFKNVSKPVAVVGDMPYIKSLNFNGTNAGMGARTSGAFGSAYNVPGDTQDAANFSNFDPILLDADAPWTFEADVMLHPNTATNSDQLIFSYWINGIGGFTVYLNKYSASDVRVKLYIYWVSPSGQSGGGAATAYSQKRFDVTDDTHGITSSLTPNGTWLRISVAKGTGTSMRDIVTYVNGYTGSNENYWSGRTDGSFNFSDSMDGTNSGERALLMGCGNGGDVNVGMVAFYNKQLSSTEVNENYDDGARSGGSADAAEVMVQDLRTTSTSANLKHYYFYDSDNDSGSAIVSKNGTNLEMRTLNQTVSQLLGPSVPQIPLFKSGADSAFPRYAGEAASMTQPASGTSGTTVKWYSDSGYSSLLSTGATYNFTVPSAGAQGLYVKETKTWPSPYGAVEQTADWSYTSYTAGHSTHSFIAHDGTTGKLLRSAALAADSVWDTAGGISVSWWWKSKNKFSWMELVSADNGSGSYTYKFGINGWVYNAPQLFVFNENGGKYQGMSGYSSGEAYHGTEDTWNHTTITWDWDSGTVALCANGDYLNTVTNSHFEGKLTAGGADSVRLDINGTGWTNLHCDEIAVYKGALTQAECEALTNGRDPGDSVDITGLSSYSKIVEHWQIDGDTFSNSSGDHINATESSTANDIAVANSASTRKSINRP